MGEQCGERDSVVTKRDTMMISAITVDVFTHSFFFFKKERERDRKSREALPTEPKASSGPKSRVRCMTR